MHSHLSHFLTGRRSPETLKLAVMPASPLPRPSAPTPAPPQPLLLSPAPAAVPPPLPPPVSLLLVAPDPAAPFCRGLLKPPVRLLPAWPVPGALGPAAALLGPRDRAGPLQLTALAAGRTPADGHVHSRHTRHECREQGVCVTKSQRERMPTTPTVALCTIDERAHTHDRECRSWRTASNSPSRVPAQPHLHWRQL